MTKIAFISFLILFLGFSVFADDEKPVASGKAKIVSVQKGKLVAIPTDAEVIPANEPAEGTVIVSGSHEEEKTSQAKEESSLSWGRVFLKYILDLVFAVLGIVATGFVTVLLRKYKFDSFTAKVNDLLERAVGFAEQKSVQALKLTGKPLEGAVKLDFALEFVKNLSIEYGLEGRSKDWWIEKIEGWIGAKRIG